MRKKTLYSFRSFIRFVFEVVHIYSGANLPTSIFSMRFTLIVKSDVSPSSITWMVYGRCVRYSTAMYPHCNVIGNSSSSGTTHSIQHRLLVSTPAASTGVVCTTCVENGETPRSCSYTVYTQRLTTAPHFYSICLLFAIRLVASISKDLVAHK